ncbi:AAA domain-containing protein [Salegentibacter sp. BLCTC]|uniref:AAA family ATPase n=1 Tax=Salegentibacter sp. BLCTC TaxID=2697368 RepID=UPI00187B50BB|nr:MoxR family ATPase [Salegentibacter sp. BLCTC]MBE7640220.1 AAA domain-containing protein [Salegentibacter sp. BLCTC]
MENQENKETESLNFDSRIPLDDLKEAVSNLKNQLARVIVGQKEFVELLIAGLFSNGHVLIEGVPGVAKTLTAKLFAKSLNTNFSRIQFTPDLMPGDVLGTSVLNAQKSEFEFKPGPIFSNIVLIDEINRAPAKTQAALFEVMEERQITIDGVQHNLEAPFMVLATQNPIEQEGTYALPEAQLDRFLFKIEVGYPGLDDEIAILKTHHERKGSQPISQIEAILDPKNLKELKDQIQEIIIEEKLMHYIASIVGKTRNHSHIYLGASPRASIAVMSASKAFAAINGRDFVIPEDIKKVLNPVLAHRLIISPDREMEGITAKEVIEMISQSVEIPR